MLAIKCMNCGFNTVQRFLSFDMVRSLEETTATKYSMNYEDKTTLQNKWMDANLISFHCSANLPIGAKRGNVYKNESPRDDGFMKALGSTLKLPPYTLTSG